MPEHTSKPIFISHAVVDKGIADKVVDLFNTAMGINAETHVFCSSIEGLGVRGGMDFKQYIKDQIQSPRIVVLLISQNYLASQFCLAEAGASWALSHNIVPFLIPPIKFEDMKAVLAGVHALRIEDPVGWNECLEIFKPILGISPGANRWETKRDQKIKEITELVAKQSMPPLIPLNKYESVVERLKEANGEIEELEKKCASKDKLIAELKKAKNAKEVAKIELENLPAGEAFEELIGEAKGKLSEFPRKVQEAFYYYFRGEPLPAPRPGRSNTEDDWDEIQRAIENGYLTDSHELEENDPGLRSTLEALSALKTFIDENPELAAPYEEEHGHQLDFSSRRFWSTNL